MTGIEKTYTKWNIIVEDIKVWDIHYQCWQYIWSIKIRVLTKPTLKWDQYTWLSEIVETWEKVDFLVTKWMSHYAPALYDYPAYLNISNIDKFDW